jgi:hypothetical protein
MQEIVDFCIDYESLGHAPEGATIDLAMICFVDNPHNPPTFKSLIDSGIKIKFDLHSQKNDGEYPRVFDRDVFEWWKNQTPNAKQEVVPRPDDLDIHQGVKLVEDFAKEQGVDPWKSLGWCRGQSFDFALMLSQIRQVYQTRDTFNLEWCKFWNQRDMRTAIERTLMKRGMTECPLPNGTLDGFVHHNSLHDVAKDILMLIYAQRYAMGLETCPSEEDADPNSIKKKR